MSDIVEAWGVGVSLVRLFEAGPPFDMLPQVPQNQPDWPSTNYFEGPDQWEQEPELRDNIISGKWSALGYTSPRRPDTKLGIVPPEAFKEGAIDWEQSGISGDGLSYVGIRVVHSSQLNSVDVVQSVGRPNKLKRTTVVVGELIAQQLIDPSAHSKRSLLPTIQEAYRNHYNETPPGYDTIRKAIDCAITDSEKL